jgi:hypothetical protein
MYFAASAFITFSSSDGKGKGKAYHIKLVKEQKYFS